VTRARANRLVAFVRLVAFAVAFVAVRPARADIERFGVFIGNDRGDSGDAQLHYAGTDAERVRDVLQDIGDLPPSNVVFLREQDATSVRRSLIAMNDRIRARSAQPDTQIVLFVYYSGHADAAALHLGASRLDIAELEQIVRGSAAHFRVLVLDACRSGVVTRTKGGQLAPAFAVKLGEKLDGQGVVFLTSTAANEDAQESDELKGSFFTHYFTSALVGAADTDGDGRVQLDEAYRYAYDATLRATSRTWAGSQHPSFRYELGGQGRIPLTTLKSAARGTLSFPPDRAYLVFRGSQNGPVVAEVTAKAASRGLSLRPDRYFIRGRASDHVLEGELTLAAGEVRVVEDGALRRAEYARLVRKGGSDVRRVHGPVAGYTFRSALRNGTGFCHGAYAGYGLTLSTLSITARIDGCTSSFDNAFLQATTNEAGGDLRFAHAWDLPVVTVDLGLSVGGSWLRQTFEAAGNAPARDSFAARSAVNLGLAVELGGGFELTAESAAETYLFRLQTATSSSLTPSLAYRQRVGLAKHW
jgi:Caspase domain